MKQPILISLSCIIILSFFYFNFLSMQRHSVIPIKSGGKNTIKFFLPQGWGFFTRNPREDKYVLYQVSKNNTLELVTFKSTSSQNLFGLSRKGNRINIEALRIKSLLPNPNKWLNSTRDLHRLNFDSISFNPINYNPKQFDEKKIIQPGKYVFKKYSITPWNWVKHPNNYDNEYMYYFFELKKNDSIN